MHTHTPAPASHAHGVVTLDQFVTSASPFARNQVDLAQATTVLGGRALQLKQQPTLGETLAGETGIHATSFGPGASRPIIRGLGGDRVRLLENSVSTLDVSVTSPDHAVSIEPLLVERIEVVRGPASLLYGSSAVGGVVNVLTHRIETDLPTEKMRGGAEVRGNTASNERAVAGVLDVATFLTPKRAVVFHLDGARRETGNLRIPGFAETAEDREADTLEAQRTSEPVPFFSRGRLRNSDLTTKSAGMGLSFVSETFHVGASYSGVDSEYGVPGHGGEPGDLFEGTRIALRQRRTDVQGEWHGHDGVVRGVRLKVGHSRYQHSEFEPDGAVGTKFDQRGHDARLELLHGAGPRWSGAVGLQHYRAKFAADGEEAFLPSSRTEHTSVFAFEEYAASPFTWQFGGRLEHAEIGSPSTKRDGVELGLSLGTVWKLDRAHTVAISIAHTGRPPNAQEQFADGAHAGTASYEIGSTDLDSERGLATEMTLRRREGRITGAVTLFAHHFNGFIFENPTAEIAISRADAYVISPAGSSLRAGESSLPVYRYVQRNAKFRGAELEAVWHLHEGQTSQFDVRVALDAVHAKVEANNLPRIPARRATVGVAWAAGPWSLGAESQFVARQNRVAPNESPSPGYKLVSVHVNRDLDFNHLEAEIFVRGTNLLDEEARPHTSFVRHLAPLAGRAVSAGVRVHW